MRLPVLAVAVVLVAGCSSSGGGDASSSGSTGGDGRSAATGLTGLGASQSEWDAHHDAHPNPDLNPQCCYGPQVAAPGGITVDTWNLQDAGDPIATVTHNFAPGTTAARALAAVEKQDLPAGSRRGAVTTKTTCVTYAYSSTALPSISVTLFSGIATTGKPIAYSATSVTRIVETTGTAEAC